MKDYESPFWQPGWHQMLTQCLADATAYYYNNDNRNIAYRDATDVLSLLVLREVDKQPITTIAAALYLQRMWTSRDAVEPPAPFDGE